MKKYLSLIISALLITSVTACSNQNEITENSSYENNNSSVSEIEYKEELFPEIATADLPSKFDLRNYNGKNYVTPVKMQKYSDCWTFALAGSAEIAYLCANNISVPTGEANKEVNFSEKYITWYMFHGITEDDVSGGKIRASQIGEGFDPTDAENQKNLVEYFIGGPFVLTSNFYCSGFGPVDESVNINNEFPYAYNEESSFGWELPVNAKYRNAPVSVFFRNSNILPVPSGSDADGNYKFNQDGIDAIKSEICKGHGVTVVVNAENSGFNKKKRTLYYSGDDRPNHAVVAVGYDDDFSKDNFAKKNSDGEIIEGTVPPGNGALIIKNSGGLTTFDGDIDDGYFYLSYYDHCLDVSYSFEFDNNESAEHTTLYYDQYDLMMTQWYGISEYDSETKMANVFDAENDENLLQIQYRTASPETEVGYEIYKITDNDNPSSGTLLEKGIHTHQYAGSHRIDLNDKYLIKKGEKYSVVLTMKQKSAQNGKFVYTEVFPYSAKFFEGLAVKGIVNKGESFLYTDGKWLDMTDLTADLLERASTQCEHNIKTDKALPIIMFDKSTVTIDNYSIKAISCPAE